MDIRFGHRGMTRPDGSTADGWFNYVCGYCSSSVSGAVIASAGTSGRHTVKWLQCPACHEPSAQASSGSIVPGSAFGPTLEGLPTDVRDAYDEARRCLSVNANTAAEGMCRKILMHVAVDKGSKEGQTFASYIEYLEKEGYVTPPMRDWVKLIKDHGNAAQHRLDSPERRRAEGTLLFTAQLLRSVYEMGHLAGQFAPSEK